MSLAPVADSAMLQLESWVEDALIRFWPSFQKVELGVRRKRRRMTPDQADHCPEPYWQRFQGSERLHLCRLVDSTRRKSISTTLNNPSASGTGYTLQHCHRYFGAGCRYRVVHDPFSAYTLGVDQIEDNEADPNRHDVSCCSI